MEILLKDILATLESDEARAIAISQLARKVDLPAQAIKDAILFYKRTDRLADAALLALSAGMENTALAYFEKAEMWSEAAYLALKAGMEERSEELHQSFLRKYDQIANAVKKRARDILGVDMEGEIKDPRYHMSFGLTAVVADVLKEGDIERAIGFYETAGFHAEAAYLALKAGMEERAGELYQRDIKTCEEVRERFGNAALDAPKEGGVKRTIEFLEKTGKFRYAADIALNAGMKEKAEALTALADVMDLYCSHPRAIQAC